MGHEERLDVCDEAEGHGEAKGHREAERSQSRRPLGTPLTLAPRGPTLRNQSHLSILHVSISHRIH